MSEEKDSDEKPPGWMQKVSNGWNKAVTWWDNSDTKIWIAKPAYEWALAKIEKSKETDSSQRAKLLFNVVLIELGFLTLLWLTGILGYFLAKFAAYKLHNVVAILISVPPAYLLWLWRDANRRDDIEISRHDLRLTDFHKIEEWATTKQKEGEISITQIAAIHQLKPYLLGNMGTDFQRPTFEIYKALLDSWQLKEEDKDKKMFEVNIPPHIKAIHQIIVEEIIYFRQIQWKTEKKQNRNKVRYQENILRELDLKYIFLYEENLNGLLLPVVTLHGAVLSRAQFQNAFLDSANLQVADLSWINLQNTFLRWANLQGAELLGANLQGADFSWANLQGAELKDIKYDDKTIFSGAYYDSKTIFPDGFDPKAHGMRKVDEHGNRLKDKEDTSAVAAPPLRQAQGDNVVGQGDTPAAPDPASDNAGGAATDAPDKSDPDADDTIELRPEDL